MQFSSHLWYNKTMDCKRKSFVNSAPKRRNTVVSRNIGNLYPPPDKILTADYFLSGQLQAADIILLHLQRGMDIAVQSDASIRMTEQLAQSLRIKIIFHANRCISVTEHVEIHPPDTTGLQNPLKTVLHRSRFGRLGCSGHKICRWITLKLRQQSDQKFRNRDGADGSAAFRCTDDDLGCAATIHTLHRPIDRKQAIFKINVLPTQSGEPPLAIASQFA